MTDKCCHLPYQVNPFSDKTLRVFFRKELPFAGYSVVKEPYIVTRHASFESSARLASRSPRNAAAPAAKAGGEYRARTGDLLVANQALSQLS
jgi:hypothetical protein